MKSYLLLRDNQQSGPYTFEEIKQDLLPNDLVWIEGASNAWSYPTEIDDLKQYVSTKTSRKPAQKRVTTTTANIAELNSTASVALTPATAGTFPGYGMYEDVNKELYEGVKISTERKRRRIASLNANIMALLLIAIGAAMGAYIVKNVVESFSSNDTIIASAQAKEIQSINTQAEHAAYAEPTSLPQPAVLTEQQLQISADALPAQPTESEKQQLINDSKPAEVVAKEKEQTQAQLQAQTPVVAVAQTTDQPNTSEENKEEPKKEEKKANKDVRSQLNVSGSDFKVGVLGGVSGLSVSVSNGSSSSVDRATVQVNYLKPNGSVVHSETVSVSNIPAGGSKTVAVPPSPRGVKVSYRVVDAQ